MRQSKPLAGTLLGAALLFSGGAPAEKVSDYTIAELLAPCVEGDNDSRWGAAAEAECEQYISGFTDAYLMLTDEGKRDGVCLPKTGNRPDEVRWAFMRWAHEHYGRRGEPAATGLMEALKARFACKQ